jgi:apolipoprotein N-acyltransferase
MFIPNKTINIIKTVTLMILSLLIVVIVGQTVLFIKLENDNKATMSVIQTKIDSTKSFDETSLVKQATTEQKLKVTKTQVDSLNKQLNKLQKFS